MPRIFVNIDRELLPALREYDEMSASRAKIAIDLIEREVAAIYGLTKIESDFISNYDIKYRMGANVTDE